MFVSMVGEGKKLDHLKFFKEEISTMFYNNHIHCSPTGFSKKCWTEAFDPATR